MKPVHFASAAAFRQWLEKNHADADELILGFYKKSSGKGGLTYPEAVDQLLCFGWIDGVVRRIDEDAYCHRITPRRARSIWSLVNVRHVDRLTEAGLMHAAGLKAFAERSHGKTGIYAYEQKEAPARPEKFPAPMERVFKKAPQAWSFWNSQPPGYRRLTIHWVTAAKIAATRVRRLTQLISVSKNEKRIGGK